MKNKTRRQISESYNHIKPYLDSTSETSELRQMC